MEEYFVEEKSGFDKFMDLLVFIAVFVVTIFLILEILANSGKTSLDWAKINYYYFYANIVIFIIFVIDLFRLWKESNGVKDFISHNFLDILATIPFGLIASTPSFEILKGVRVTKLLKLQKASKISKISKEFKAAAHMKKESEEYQKKHRL